MILLNAIAYVTMLLVPFDTVHKIPDCLSLKVCVSFEMKTKETMFKYLVCMHILS